MKFQTVVLCVTLLSSLPSLAKTAPGGRLLLDLLPREVKETETAGRGGRRKSEPVLSKEQPDIQRGSTARDVETKAQLTELVEGCIGSCTLPLKLETMFYDGGKSSGFEAEQMNNAYELAKRSHELVNMGFSSEVATSIAARELGLNPQKISRDCP